MVHMKLDLARQRRVVDILITDLAKFFDVITQDVHPIVGAHVGLGRPATWLPTRKASRIPCPWAHGSRIRWRTAWETPPPPGTIQGVHAGATVALPFLQFMDIAYRTYAVQPFRFPGLMWVDDTIVLLERGDTHPIQGVLLDQRTYY